MKTRRTKKMEARLNKIEKRQNMLAGGLLAGCGALVINAYCTAKINKQVTSNAAEIKTLYDESDVDCECDFCED